MNTAIANKTQHLKASDFNHPVVVFANGYGDHYLNLPALRALATMFDGRMTLVGIATAIEQISEALPACRVIGVPMKHIGTGRAFDVDQAVSGIGRCDLLISMNPWQSDDLSALIERLEPQLTISFFDSYQIQLQRDYTKHSVDLAFDFVRLFQPDWRPEQFAAPPVYEEIARLSAEKILGKLPADKKMLCIHPDTLPEKMWPEACWVSLIDQFLAQHPDYYVLVIGLRGINTSQCQRCDAVIPAYRLPIPISAELLAKAHLFIGIDSVFLHIADLFHVPTIGLFGPTPSHEWGLRFGPGEHLHANGDMNQLKVEEVLSACVAIANS